MHCEEAGSDGEAAYPSYRLTTALRLHALYEAHKPVDPLQLDIWHKVVRGEREIVSSGNEKVWKSVLGNICARVIKRASLNAKATHSTTTPFPDALTSLWEEEQKVSQAILNKVHDMTLEW